MQLPTPVQDNSNEPVAPKPEQEGQQGQAILMKEQTPESDSETLEETRSTRDPTPPPAVSLSLVKVHPLQAEKTYVCVDQTVGAVVTRMILDVFKFYVIVGLAFALWLSPTIREPVLSACRSSICASPFNHAFSFCRGAEDVIVMHDFTALAQVHSQTLSTLYDAAVGVWSLSDELAIQGRDAKQLAFYVEDSQLDTRSRLANDLHHLNADTKTAATSLNKLGAATVGAVMRTGSSFERIFRVVSDAQLALSAGPTSSYTPTVQDLAHKFQRAFHLAVAELREDLELLQTATSYTLGDLAVLEAQVDAIAAVARREDRAAQADLEALDAQHNAAWLSRTRDRVRTQQLAREGDGALALAIRKSCEEARGVIAKSSAAVAVMLADMEYLGTLPTTRLLMDGLALPELVSELKGYSAGIESTLQAFEKTRAQERAKRWAPLNDASRARGPQLEQLAIDSQAE